MKYMIITLVKTLIIGYLLLGLTIWLVADSILFQPPRTAKQPLLNEITIPLANQQKISAVYLPNPRARYTILFSHGNAEDLASLMPFLQLLKQQGFAVLAYDYPGYGNSTGKPTEANTYEAINAAYHYLTTKLSLPPENIIIYGRSLGTGPSTELASKQRCAGLILESPFVSAYRVYTYWPIYPFDQYQNLYKIPQVMSPILLIHGTHDSVIPVWHGRKIFAAAKSPKQAYWVENASHNDVLRVANEKYWHTINQFVASLSKD